MDKKILFTTPGNIAPKDKMKLSMAGTMVIEVADLSAIKYSSDIENTFLLEAAMHGLEGGNDYIKARFFSKLYKLKYPKP